MFNLRVFAVLKRELRDAVVARVRREQAHDRVGVADDAQDDVLGGHPVRQPAGQFHADRGPVLDEGISLFIPRSHTDSLRYRRLCRIRRSRRLADRKLGSGRRGRR